jgi:hypothetical protein
MIVIGEKYIYHNPDVFGYGEQAAGGPGTSEMSSLDLADGTEVTLLENDADSGWPIVEWVDSTGLGRITTIDPILFDTQFLPS